MNILVDKEELTRLRDENGDLRRRVKKVEEWNENAARLRDEAESALAELRLDMQAEKDIAQAAFNVAQEAESHAKRLDEYMLKGVAFRDELQAKLNQWKDAALWAREYFNDRQWPEYVQEIDRRVKGAT
jgi:hypothetical protein